MLKAAVEAKAEGICHPIVLGNDEAITKLAKELDLSLEGIEIVNLRHPNEAPRRERYARILAEKRDNIVFILWGSYAQKKGAFIDRSRHLVLTSPHPSPLSAYHGFFGNHHFTQANEYLKSHNKSGIVW